MDKGSGNPSAARFGTFGGVFTPCTLTILGVIMFLRFSQVVGQSGILYALLIVLAAKVITALTGLSLSAIATNSRVKGGGAYYLISRSLGVEFGGAIGVVFYLAQAISVAMYVLGFTEALVDTFPALHGRFVAAATLVNVVVLVCVYVGAGWTIKVQYAILAILGGAIASFCVGAAASFDASLLRANLRPAFAPGESTFSMFALFFPAVTGIMAGANMSGDLKDPARSIPRGTLAAVAVTAIVYLSMAILLGSARTSRELVGGSLVVRDIARWPLLITAGMFAATLSSALGSMMGAPRILQAFARDEVFSRLRFFAAGSGGANEPRRATLLTFVIAQTCILLGDLNAIAPIITMFFLITYGLLNLATFYEAITRNPSYRPTFRWCHWSLSLAGVLGCGTVMFLINWLWAAVAIAVIFALHWYIRFREIEGRWGDLRSGVTFERARQGLLRLEELAYHPKNWRPVILVLSGSAWTRPHLAVYGHWLTAGHGILTLAQIVQDELDEHAGRRDGYERTLRKFIAKEELQAFPAVVVADDFSRGVEALIQCHGIGALKPNTVLLGWPTQQARAEVFGTTLRLIRSMNRSAIAVRFLEHREGRDPDAEEEEEGDPWEVPHGTIDVWWRGRDNGPLMVLLAHLLHQNPEWRRNGIRVLRCVAKREAEDQVREHIRELAARSRIQAEPVVMLADDPAKAIHETSANAAVVILGFEPPDEGQEAEFLERMDAFAGPLPRVLLVNSAGGMELES
ncbi:MAG TPA: amino acid permease [Phycisphaerae bacterium]|nr:amino acid permease [Phycisphaerae bacterium]